MAGNGTFKIDVGCGLIPIITGVLSHLAYTLEIKLATVTTAAINEAKKNNLKNRHVYE